MKKNTRSNQPEQSRNSEKRKGLSRNKSKPTPAVGLIPPKPGSFAFSRLPAVRQNAILKPLLDAQGITRKTPAEMRTRPLADIFIYHTSVDLWESLKQGPLVEFGRYVGPDKVATKGGDGVAIRLTALLRTAFGGKPETLPAHTLNLRNEAVHEIWRFLDECMAEGILTRAQAKKELWKIPEQVASRVIKIGGDL